jgi:hypothetical protein
MKVYIDDYDPKNLIDKLDKLKQYLINSSNYVKIYSDEGIYNIYKSKIYKTIIEKEEIIRYSSIFYGLQFIIDKSTVNEENIFSIPFNHIDYKIYKNEYKINIKSNIKLIIEGYYVENQDSHNNSNSILFSPNNFYFELLNYEINNINEIFKNDDINVFLSLLK